MIRINVVGQLGNQMYQYNFCRYVAELKCYNFYVGYGKNYHFGRIGMKPYDGQKTIFDYFDLENGKVCDVNKMWYEKDNLSLDTIKDDTLLNGFFCEDKYVDLDKVNEWFKLNTIDTNDDAVYIHYRGKDFINIKYGNLTYNYYKEAIKHFNEKKYIILTDDVENANNIFRLLENKDIISNKDPIDDLTIMANAKNLIISKSTFSQWASYLNKRRHKIVRPKM